MYFCSSVARPCSVCRIGLQSRAQAAVKHNIADTLPPQLTHGRREARLVVAGAKQNTKDVEGDGTSLPASQEVQHDDSQSGTEHQKTPRNPSKSQEPPETPYHPLTKMSQLAYTVGCWLVVLNPQLADRLVPHQLPFLAGLTTRQVLPELLLPQTTIEAFELGQLSARVQAGLLDPTTASQQAADILKIGATVLPDSWLMDLPARLQDQATASSPLAQLLGAFSLVNILWCGAILGLAVSLGPTAYLLFKPLVEELLKLTRLLWDRVLYPLYPLGSVYILFAIAVAAGRYPSDMAPYIALTALAPAMQLFNTPAPSPTDPALWQQHHQQKVVFYWGSLALCAIPLAVAYHSQLIGFFTAAAVMGALGFGVVPYGLSWSVGWQGVDFMLQTAVASLSMLTMLFLGRASGVSPEWLAPFQLGVATFGSIGLFLAGLILSSRPYIGYHDTLETMAESITNAQARKERDPLRQWRMQQRYIASNILYVVLLLGGTAGGSILGLQAVRNTALTFAVLYASEKVVEVTPKGLFWPMLLAGSGGLWWVSFFLKGHPEWLASLFAI